MGIPISRIMEMKENGMDNNQIVQKLQKEGNSASDIFNALSQAEIKTGVAQPDDSQQDYNSQYNNQQDNSSQQFNNQNFQNNMNQQPQQFNNQNFQQSQQSQQSQQFQSNNDPRIRESIEEIAEVIIEEKWNDLMKDVNKITTWKEKTEARINRLSQQLKDLKGSFNSLHDSILTKIGDYDQSITDVGSEIKAMEKVFQKVLPTLTQNVNELSRITKGLKK